jgi:hypothetical protein
MDSGDPSVACPALAKAPGVPATRIDRAADIAPHIGRRRERRPANARPTLGRLINRALTLAVACSTISIFVFRSARGEDQNIESAQIRSIVVKLSSEDVYARIWQDAFHQMIDLRRRLAERTKRPPILTTEVFTATFDAPEGQIVMAATATPKVDCESYSKVSLSPSLMTCPLRVALVQGKDFRVVYETKSFPFSIGVTESGEINSEDKQNYTTVTFDPVNKTLTTMLIEGGARKREGDSSETVIHLNY